MKTELYKDTWTITQLGDLILELKLVPWEHFSPAPNNLILIDKAPLWAEVQFESSVGVSRKTKFGTATKLSGSLKHDFNIQFCQTVLPFPSVLWSKSEFHGRGNLWDRKRVDFGFWQGWVWIAPLHLRSYDFPCRTSAMIKGDNICICADAYSWRSIHGNGLF